MKQSLQSARAELGPMLRLAIPLVVAEIGWIAMSIVDTMMVGRLPNSAEAIGAVGMGGVLFYAIAIFGAGLLLGLDTLVSQSFGAGRLDDCHRWLVNGAYLAALLAPPLMALVALCELVLVRTSIQPAVVRAAIPYLNALVWGLPPLLLYFAFRRYLQAINVVRPITWALLTANLVNAAANWVLIFGKLGMPAMGPAGAGWATAASRTYLATVLLVCIIRHDRRHGKRLGKVRLLPDWRRIRTLFQLGLPVGLQYGLEVSLFAVAAGMIGTLDAASLAAHQVAINLASFTYMVPLGISSAAAVRVGQAIGRADPRGASHSGWTAIALGAGFMGAAGIVFLLFPRQIVRLFTPDPAVIAVGVLLLSVAAFFQLFDGLQTVATGALRGAGDTRTPMICHMVAYWTIGLPLGYYFCFRRGWGAPGLWLGLCVALILIGSALLWAWHRTVRGFRAAGITVESPRISESSS